MLINTQKNCQQTSVSTSRKNTNIEPKYAQNVNRTVTKLCSQLQAYHYASICRKELEKRVKLSQPVTVEKQ